MLIDWFTVCAQVVNFLILVWLMKRFLYKPILNAIDVREKSIAKEVSEANAKRSEADKDMEAFRQKSDEFDLLRASLLTKATNQAKSERELLLQAARTEADNSRTKRQEALSAEYVDLSEQITQRTRAEVFAIARKALSDLASASLEELMAGAFTKRLKEMNGKAKEGFAEALKTTSTPAIVRTAFELPPQQREEIQNAVNESFSSEVPLTFEKASDLVGGIELCVTGQKLAWNIADYVNSMERGLANLVDPQPAREPARP